MLSFEDFYPVNPPITQERGLILQIFIFSPYLLPAIRFLLIIFVLFGQNAEFLHIIFVFFGQIAAFLV